MNNIQLEHLAPAPSLPTSPSSPLAGIARDSPYMVYLWVAPFHCRWAGEASLSPTFIYTFHNVLS